MEPLRPPSVGLTSKTSDVQPSPSANCGQTDPFGRGVSKTATGTGGRRKSLRVFTRVRNATTATGTSDVKLQVPLKALGALKGHSSKNRPSWPFAGTVTTPCATSTPVESANLNCNTAGLTPGAAMLMAVRVEPP